MTFHTRSPLALAALAAAAVFGFAAPAAVGPAPAAFADAVDDSIAQLKEASKASDDGKAIAKITELEGKLDARITDAFAEVARSAKSDKIAKAAMKAAAQRKHEGLLKWLKSKIDDKKMAEDRKEVYLAVLDSLAFYGDKSALKPLEDVTKKYLPTDAEIAKRAIAAYGSVREKPVVDQLLKWLSETGNTRGGGQSGKNMSAAQRESYEACNKAILKVLEKLTLLDMGDANSWTNWWEENKKTFEFPDPNAPEIDFATIEAYVDPAYGFTLKKPAEGKFWQFAKCDDAGGRVSLFYRDDQNMLWSRTDVLTWKGNGDINSPEKFAQWYEKNWREKEFSDFSKPPAIEQRKIGGHDFTVISARGIGADSWKTWEGVERRVYITRPSPALFLYFQCAIRTGAEDALKHAYFAAIENMAFKK